MSEKADAFRWQGFFQHAAQPMFLVNRRRRVLFVNRAWEVRTGLALAEVRGRACRRRSASATLDREDAVLTACAPPTDALEGRSCQVRRRAPAHALATSTGADWWEIQFVPISGERGLLGILGIVRILTGEKSTPPGVPESLMAIRDRQASRYRLDTLGAQSPVMQRLHQQARLAASSRMPLVIHGEPGTGKQWLARAIHQQSDRHRYFVCFDARLAPVSALEDIVFGPRASQFAVGTLFVRQPSCLPREWQARFTEVLRGRENPDLPRLMVGFDSDPLAEMKAGKLLEEFYCAVSPMTLVIPPLRERLDELPGFIEVFLERARSLQPHDVRGVSLEGMNLLRTQAWPGNLRELLEIVRDACRRARGAQIEVADLPLHIKQGVLPAERRLPLDALLEQVERRLITLALKLTQNNQTRAAELLEIWRPRLLRRMEALGIKPGE